MRASGIPARYVYGTVDIDAKQAMDWVGGVSNIDAAQNLLGQGGIPNQALMDGAKAKYLRLEHTWVEANVSNLPAKGSIANTKNNQNNAYQNNTWIPLDASYKSYLRTQGIDLAKAVPFDTQKLINQARYINMENMIFIIILIFALIFSALLMAATNGSSDNNYFGSRITKRDYTIFIYIFIFVMLITAVYIIFFLKF